MGAGDDTMEPSEHWNINSFSQSKPGIPSILKSRVVGTVCNTSLGILQSIIKEIINKLTSYLTLYVVDTTKTLVDSRRS